jgi:hypothetical protein
MVCSLEQPYRYAAFQKKSWVGGVSGTPVGKNAEILLVFFLE